MDSCPKCVTVCKQPHCVTHCQAPKPECEPVCEEPKCDWKCAKPNCPKPKCELVCENPTCVPKVECCNCGMGGSPSVATPFPFFKETESNSNCCGCDKNKSTGDSQGIHYEIPQLNLDPINKRGSEIIEQRPGSVTRIKTENNFDFFKKQEPVGPPQLSSNSVPENSLDGLNGKVRDMHPDPQTTQ
jgi:hypothetical protein